MNIVIKKIEYSKVNSVILWVMWNGMINICGLFNNNSGIVFINVDYVVICNVEYFLINGFVKIG